MKIVPILSLACLTACTSPQNLKTTDKPMNAQQTEAKLTLTVPSALYSVKVISSSPEKTVLKVIKNEGMGAMMLTKRTVTIPTKTAEVRVICDNPELLAGMNKESNYHFEKQR